MTTGYSLQDIRFAPLALNKEDDRRHRQKDSDNVQSGQSIMERQGKAIGLDKSSNLKSFPRKEALNEKTFTMAWRDQRMSFFMIRATRKL